MKRVVLVTGMLACNQIKELAQRAGEVLEIEVDVICLSLPVAAMMSAEYLERELPKHTEKIGRADMVLVPGLASGDMSRISRALGIEVVKGPRYAGDILDALQAVLKGLKLSPTQPADDVLVEYLKTREQEVLEASKSRARERAFFHIGNLPVSSYYPLVVVEIYTDLPLRRSLVEYADVIVVGAPYGTGPDCLKLVLEELRKTGKPVGIDVPEPSTVLDLASVVDIINGVPVEHVDWLVKHADTLKNKTLVITSPQVTAEERVKLLLEARDHLRNYGFTKVVLDPVLSPPLTGLAESLRAYTLLKSRAPDTPVIMGVGNVTELSDVDSIGVNALLAFIGVELGIELYLTTEASVKTRGCVRELRRALDMAIIAREMKRPPKDLSITMLYLKSKKRTALKPPVAKSTIEAVERHKTQLDPRGHFKIWVDHDRDNIIIQFYEYGSPEPIVEIRGRDPFAILKVILERNLASRLDHFFYLGYELAKAEIALAIGKEYEQDKNIFQVNDNVAARSS